MLLTGGLTLLWFWLGNRWLIRHQAFKLLYIDDALPEQMNALLDQHRGPGDAPLQHKLQLLRWPEHWQAHPELCPSTLEVQGALMGNDSPACPEHQASLERQRLLTQLKLRHIRLYSPQAIAEALTGRLSAQTMASDLWQPDNNPAP